MPWIRKPPEDRFWAKVIGAEDPTKCWIWVGAKGRRGYGHMRIYDNAANKWISVGAHRISWTFKNGPVPSGMFICHRCDNPSCVNPDHLFVGTQADNILDMTEKGRGKTEHLRGGHKFSPVTKRGFKRTDIRQGGWDSGTPRK